MSDSITKLSKARYAALIAVKNVRKNKAYAKDVLNKTFNEHVLSLSDKSFASKLTLGVVQTLGTLDDAIYRCVDSPDDIKNNVMDCLRISTYEILYLEKEPHAAVDQGVELVKAIEPKAKGLANLVLRRVVKLKKEFPFGNPDNNLDAFARIYAVPKWICDLIHDSIGEKPARYLISSSNGAAPCYVFVNSLKSNFQECFDLFEQNDAKPEKMDFLCGIELKNCIWIKNASALQNTEIKNAQETGKFIISDAASQAVVKRTLSCFNKGVSFLDLCCGKGNKAIMYQVLSKKINEFQMDYTAVDNVEEKLNILKSRSQKCGVDIKNTFCCDSSDKNALESCLGTNKFDIVFCDGPCSGLGTLRRHPELKWRLTISKIVDLSDLNLRILLNAANYVKDGGILSYSTCTVDKLENQYVVEKFLESNAGKQFKLVPHKVEDKNYPYLYTQTYSGLNDTHFSAVMIKSNSL